jgi:hypothetical protein
VKRTFAHENYGKGPEKNKQIRQMVISFDAISKYI